MFWGHPRWMFAEPVLGARENPMNNLELVYPSPRERKTSFDTQRSNEFSSTPSQFGGCLEKVCHVQRSIENIAHFSLGLDQRSACDTSIKKSGFAPNQSWGLHIVLKENKTKTESEAQRGFQNEALQADLVPVYRHGSTAQQEVDDFSDDIESPKKTEGKFHFNQQRTKKYSSFRLGLNLVTNTNRPTNSTLRLKFTPSINLHIMMTLELTSCLNTMAMLKLASCLHTMVILKLTSCLNTTMVMKLIAKQNSRHLQTVRTK
ncbi:hypothetical protein RRG08_045410 [Elysia crispata]|uniref:Uncharacterized protein n=1 Tax=Elysia crispata TaxID=231223 RepID=A0AAE0XMG5_9GAST|nr:hypothetical protein RRG08_045410 [Elysia crispata]